MPHSSGKKLKVKKREQTITFWAKPMMWSIQSQIVCDTVFVCVTLGMRVCVAIHVLEGPVIIIYPSLFH